MKRSLIILAACIVAGCRTSPDIDAGDIISAITSAIPKTAEAPAVTPTTTTTTTQPPSPSGPTVTGRIVRVYPAGNWLLGIEMADMNAYPDWHLSNGKVVCGMLMFNGNEVDKIGRNTTRKTLANLAHGSSLHQSIIPGQVVAVTVRSRDGKLITPAAPFEWPAAWGKTTDREFKREYGYEHGNSIHSCQRGCWWIDSCADWPSA